VSETPGGNFVTTAAIPKLVFDGFLKSLSPRALRLFLLTIFVSKGNVTSTRLH
jgi:hypothetical protein